MLKKLGISDFLFWINMWIYLFIILYISLVLLFTCDYALNKLPFAAYNYGLVWIIAIPITAALVSFACFFAMVIKSDKLLIILSTLTMLSFTVFPLLLAVFDTTLKTIWDPSLIPVEVNWLFFVITPLFSSFALLEMTISILTKDVINGFDLNISRRFSFSYLFGTKW